MFNFVYAIDSIEPPTSLQLSASRTFVNASWDPLPEKFVLGRLVGYQISLNEYSGGSVYSEKTNATSIIIKNLQHGTTYLFSVSGYTVNETGGTNYEYFHTGN